MKFVDKRETYGNSKSKRGRLRTSAPFDKRETYGNSK